LIELSPTPKLPALHIGPVVVDPPLLQAPMAGFTNYAFRQIVRGFGGAGLQATEMISARGFLGMQSHSDNLPDRLWGVADEPRPLAVQIWDNDPEALASVGAKLAHELKVTVVDINFGCPVRQVTERAKSGSYLLRCPEKMGEIIERVVAACKPVPVTAKIRLGCTRDQINAIDIAQVVEGAGASALTVHGRTAADFFKGSADWEKISEIRPFLKKIPLIGNGDLDSPRAVLEAFDRYAIDGVMIARAALGRPWLFRQAQAALRGEQIPADPSLEEQRQLLLHHFDLICRRFGTEKGCVLMRKYACCYAQGRRGARTFRSQVAVIETAEEFFRVVEESFPRDSETQSASETSPVSISSGPLTCSSTSTGGNEKTL
jgi:tRNA-dihydrouridine synthase B